ncbi:hypothetical protein L7F22_052551 [Adiantum nelumboides]|nr:hypothetical protein [Adiantum nelumboides]
MNQKEHNPTNPDHSDIFPANFEQRRYLHKIDSFEQRAAWNSSSSSCFQPSKHHGRHGEPFYRSLLKPHHCSQPPFVEYVEGVQHRHHNPYLFETESPAVAGSCFSPQYVNYSPCSCGSPMPHESNTRKGQSYHSSSTLRNEITLHNWYLIRSGDSHTSDIAVGGFLSSRCNEVDRVETTTIVKRLEECKLLTKDGDVINLLGPIDDYRTVSNGFHLQTAHLFMSGFPHIWNLLVGMGLPAKAAGTTSSSRSCDFHGGEVTFQERLWKDTSGQREYMEHLPAFKESETDQVFYPEGERSCGVKHATKASCAEINEIIPENAVQTEQDISVVDGDCQSKEDPLILHTQAQDKDVDKNVGAKDSCAERTEHEAAHIWKPTLNRVGLYCDCSHLIAVWHLNVIALHVTRHFLGFWTGNVQCTLVVGGE